MDKKQQHDPLRIIFARVNRRLRRRVEQQAKSEGISLSDVVRRAVIRDLAQLKAKRLGQHKSSRLRSLPLNDAITTR